MNPRSIAGAFLATALAFAALPLAHAAGQGGAGSAGSSPNPTNSPNTAGQIRKVQVLKEIVTKTGLRYADLKVGEGAEAQPGKTVDVDYTGWLKDGTKFDASDRSKPFTFRIGIDEVIQGWHEGITGMRVGGKRRLVIPPELGYGKQGAGEVIPRNATLIYEVELLGVR
jgi:FKBP-type peptidyl-prolyl cis-trans isomerase